MTSKTSSVTPPTSTTTSTATTIRYHGKDSEGQTYGIEVDFHFVKSRDANKYPQCNKNDRICFDEKYPVLNNQVKFKAGPFGVVFKNINCTHESIPNEDLRLNVHCLLNPDGEVDRSWLIKNGSTDAFDTNPGAGDNVGKNVQFTIDHAIKYGVELTDEQIALGVEKTTEKTGLFTIVTSLSYIAPPMITKGGFRGESEPTPNKRFRSTTEDDHFLKGYSLGRVGGGSEAFTKADVVDVTNIENTDFRTIVRTYVDDTTSTDIAVKYMKTREELQASATLPPFREDKDVMEKAKELIEEDEFVPVALPEPLIPMTLNELSDD